MTSASRTPTRRASVRKAVQEQQAAYAAGDELPRDVRCEYPSKFCNNHKALKTKGGMHKFCEYHRRKANLNQKRWQQRRREMREQRELKRQKYTAKEEPTAPEPVTSPTPCEDPATPLKITSESTELDVLEPFPISQLTTTPPPATDFSMPLASTDVGVGFPNVPNDDYLDILTTLFFHDTPAPVYPLYNWSADVGYALRGPNAAIV